MSLTDLAINELHAGFRSGKFSIRKLIDECYENIEKHNPELNAFITIVDRNEALREASVKEGDIKSMKSPLFGIPYVLKDAYVTEGIKTTCASNVLDGFIPPYSSTVYQKLKSCGAILIGKMNMDAWGHGGSSENTDYKPVRNPYDSQRSAGGSSGGPAAAIAARMALFAIGEDTGGSIRNPSAWCGITGLKVTYGRVSRYGTISYASSFDTVGPMAKSSEDCSVVLNEIAGWDSKDATSSKYPVDDYLSTGAFSPQGLSLGFPDELFESGLDPEIKSNIFGAMEIFKKAGMKVRKISMPVLEFGIPVYYLIGPSETSSNLARYDGIRYGLGREYFTEETKRRIMMGTYSLSSGYYDAYYKKAQKARTLLIRDYEKAFKECDAIVMPVTPTPPTKIGELVADPLKNLLADVYTVTQNPAGVPSLALPCGFNGSGLPSGMQLVGKMFSEKLLLGLGKFFQDRTDWHKRRPL